MNDGHRVNAKTINRKPELTHGSYKAYLHFHIASTFKMSMFRCFKAA